ncbi:hypothetical protein TcYC6_0062930 [Trypanosoma cruzi]|uniref:Uncharacterized protein n=1 Tax=Trypanosoma cruzi TaxID=5693 RepID=A0A7J6YAL9_TRYCR|nr:hypothetical protein ECC02_002985 [Trypanosoma cruzi]KAF8299821.1 hypothetical protein TcYC6_0062930 [Trypanosoma cruzi]
MAEHLLEQLRDVMVLQPSDGAVGNGEMDTSAANSHKYSVVSTFTNSPFVAVLEDTENNEDDEKELIRLLDELSHRIHCSDAADDVERPSGSFAVEKAEAPTLRASHMAPPIYGSPAPAGGSPFNYASCVSQTTKPPPSFAEAVATTPPLSEVPVELSPLAAHYVPPMPAVQQDPILLRNTHGVFMLRPITKPTPPYTPPSLTSSISQPPRYALPPAALPQSQPHFLGSSLAQVGGLADAQIPKKSSFSPYEIPHSMNNVIGGSQILGTGGAGNYTYISTSVKSKSTSHMQPPPPYPS